MSKVSTPNAYIYTLAINQVIICSNSNNDNIKKHNRSNSILQLHYIIFDIIIYIIVYRSKYSKHIIANPFRATHGRKYQYTKQHNTMRSTLNNLHKVLHNCSLLSLYQMMMRYSITTNICIGQFRFNEVKKEK